MIATFTNLPLAVADAPAPAYAPTLASKLAEARKGSYAIDAADKLHIADEIGRMTTPEYMALWEAQDDRGRKALIALVAAACGPDIAASVIQDWLMAEAVEVATGRVRAQMAGALRDAERALEEAAAAANEALHQEKLALAERAEALELLREARRMRADAATLAEVEDLRAQLRAANARLDAISAALAG